MLNQPEQFDQDDDVDGCLKLFVGGLNYLSLQSDIRSYFETFGDVTSCSLLQDKSTSKSRGFAFVTLKDTEKVLADKILTKKHEINGKIVDVKPAVEGKKREEMLDSSKKVFVGGLEPTVNSEDLKMYFSEFGQVREACVLFDNNRGASRCFGFVTFENRETVELLVRNNHYVIKGKPVDVKQALPKSMQKTQNIRCQSAVDTILNKHKKNDVDFHGKTFEEDTQMMDLYNNKGGI